MTNKIKIRKQFYFLTKLMVTMWIQKGIHVPIQSQQKKSGI